MYPHERSLVKRMAGKPFALLGINSDDSREHVKQAMAQQHITWPSWFDGGTRGPISTTWDVQAWPMTYVLDARGVIRDKDVRGEELDKIVDKLMAER